MKKENILMIMAWLCWLISWVACFLKNILWLFSIMSFMLLFFISFYKKYERKSEYYFNKYMKYHKKYIDELINNRLNDLERKKIK